MVVDAFVLNMWLYALSARKPRYAGGRPPLRVKPFCLASTQESGIFSSNAAEFNMLAFANCGPLILSGAVIGACIDHWFMGAGIGWASICTSLLIAIIAAESVRKVFARPSAPPTLEPKSAG
jgi:hypothetical protein